MSLTIRMIYPASQVPFALLPERIEELQAQGFRLLVAEPPARGPNAWPYTCADPSWRAAALREALLEEESDILLCARGGYGASDLLPSLPWAELGGAARRKWLVGFSDICSLQSALWAKLGWPSIHGPMPGSDLWRKNGSHDIEALYTLLRSPRKSGELALSPLSARCAETSVTGWLFGGCFSVLTNLIGTPYFPASLAGAILFLEDTHENPGRLMRYWNQWLQSGVLTGLQGLILGHLKESGPFLSELAIKEEFAARSRFPVWSARDLGHTSPNMPLVLGAQAEIGRGHHTLKWQLGEERR